MKWNELWADEFNRFCCVFLLALVLAVGGYCVMPKRPPAVEDLSLQIKADAAHTLTWPTNVTLLPTNTVAPKKESVAVKEGIVFMMEARLNGPWRAVPTMVEVTVVPPPPTNSPMCGAAMTNTESQP